MIGMARLVLIIAHRVMIPLGITIAVITEPNCVINIGLEMTVWCGAFLEIVQMTDTIVALVMEPYHVWITGMVQTVQRTVNQEMIVKETTHVPKTAQRFVEHIGLEKNVTYFVER